MEIKASSCPQHTTLTGFHSDVPTPICYFLGSSLFHPSPPLFFFSNPLTLHKREKRIERKGKCSLNKFKGGKGVNVIIRLLAAD